MDTAAALFQVVDALRQAQHCDGHVLQADGVAEALQLVVPAEEATLNEHHMRHQQSELVELFETASGDSPGPFWDHFPDTVACSYTERHPRLRLEVMRTSDFYSDREWHSTGMYAECFRPAGLDQALVIPLPGPLGIARRLGFVRPPGRGFSDAERDAAVLLQPHITEALRLQARRVAAQMLTARQLQLLRMVALGHDNSAIARELRISPLTVRKHLENINMRLGVTSRTAAAARAFPDITWS